MFMQRIKLRNILSFGPGVQELELERLNVLIGAKRLREVELDRGNRALAGCSAGLVHSGR